MLWWTIQVLQCLVLQGLKEQFGRSTEIGQGMTDRDGQLKVGGGEWRQGGVVNMQT